MVTKKLLLREKRVYVFCECVYVVSEEVTESAGGSGSDQFSFSHSLYLETKKKPGPERIECQARNRRQEKEAGNREMLIIRPQFS